MGAAVRSRTSPVSREMAHIRTRIESRCVDGALLLDAAETDQLLKHLAIVERQIETLEDELGVFRAIEQDRAAAAVLDDEAFSFMHEGLLDAEQADGNIVRPNFKGGRTS